MAKSLVLFASLVLALSGVPGRAQDLPNCAGTDSPPESDSNCTDTSFNQTVFDAVDLSSVVFDNSVFTDVQFLNGSIVEDSSFVNTTWEGNSTVDVSTFARSDFSDATINLITFQSLEPDAPFNSSARNTRFLSVNADTMTFSQMSGVGAFFIGSKLSTFAGVTSDFDDARFDDTVIKAFTADTCSFNGARFDRANITSAEFTNSDAINSSFSGFGTEIGTLKVSGADFSDAKFVGVTFGDVAIDESDFSGASFFKSNFTSLSLTQVTAQNAEFGATRFNRMIVMNSSLDDSSFVGAKLRNAQFVGSNLTSTVFLKAVITDTSFSEADLSMASFRGAKLTNILFDSTKLESIDFVDAVLNNVTASRIDGDCCSACAQIGCTCTLDCPTFTPPPPPSVEPTPVVPETPVPTEIVTPAPTMGPSASESETPSDDDSVCFPASAEVQLEDGTIRTMDKLEVGDRVRVSPDTYSPIYFFSHRQTEGIFKFVQINAPGAVLRLTPNHLLYVNGELAAAKTVQAGDRIETVSGAAVVSAVDNVYAKGLFNPHTYHGDVAVDGVITSTFTTSVPHRLASLLLAPERIAHSLGLSLYGSMLNKSAPRFLELARRSLPSF